LPPADTTLAGSAAVRRTGITEHVEGWDELLAPEDFFQTSRWLQVVAAVAGTPVSRLLSPADAAPAAGLVTVVATEASPWLLARPDTLLRDSVADGLAGAAGCQAALGNRPLLPSLVCGGRHIGRTRAVGAPDQLAEHLPELIEAAEDSAGEQGLASICYPHVDERDAELVAALRQRGYLEHVSAEYCWLPIPPGGMEEYLAGVSKHRRRRVRLARRHLDEAGVRIWMQPLAGAPLDRLGELEAALLTKYGNPASPESSAELLSQVADRLGDDALVSLACLDETIIAFALVLRNGSHWFGHRAGFDYELQRDLPLYEEVLYYRVIDEAAPAGGTVLHVGIGSADTKRSLHCEVSRQSSFLKVLNGLDASPRGAGR
jgi:uncharacterized protein